MSSCLCTGACLTRGCSAYPNGRANDNFNVLTPPNFAEIQNFRQKINSDVDSIRKTANAQENTINFMQNCLESSFEWLEKLDPERVKPDGKVINPFEFIAVDAKRRDDIKHIKESLYELYKWIIFNVQDNKERSKGIECLEEAAMWLNKSISRRKDNGT